MAPVAVPLYILTLWHVLLRSQICICVQFFLLTFLAKRSTLATLEVMD